MQQHCWLGGPHWEETLRQEKLQRCWWGLLPPLA